MTRTALAHLYPNSIPCRGDVRVELRQPLDEGVAGVIGSVAGLITGAANEGGFKGLGGRFARRNLLRFGVPMDGEIRLTRVDTARSIELTHHPQAVLPPPTLKRLREQANTPAADAVTRRAFAEGWQDWVRSILIEHADDPVLIERVA